jgi:hypothetical protein
VSSWRPVSPLAVPRDQVKHPVCTSAAVLSPDRHKCDPAAGDGASAIDGRIQLAIPRVHGPRKWTAWAWTSAARGMARCGCCIPAVDGTGLRKMHPRSCVIMASMFGGGGHFARHRPPPSSEADFRGRHDKDGGVGEGRTAARRPGHGGAARKGAVRKRRHA